jgi:hypothetical protein
VNLDTDRLYVNMPASLGRRVRALAVKERRTVNGQIEVLLERGLAATSSNGTPALADESKEVAAA